MIYKKINVILSFIIITWSCNNDKLENKIETVKINPLEVNDEINLSEIVDSIKIIRLQTDSNSVMGRVRRVIVKDKYIYAIDASQQIIFVFDHNGKFISKLDKRGKGPGEYNHLGFIFIDEDEEYIEVLNMSKNNYLIKYSNITFNYIDKEPIQRIAFNAWRREGDIIYCATQQRENIIDNTTTNAALIILKNNKVAKILFDKNIETQHSSYSPNIESFTKNNKGELFVSIMFDNSFYQLSGLKAGAVITIDFEGYSIDNTISNKPLKEQKQYLLGVNNLASFPVLNINNSNIMVISYKFRQRGKDILSAYRQYIKLKKSGKVFHTKNIKNDLTSFPDKVYLSTYYYGVAHEAWYKDYLVDIIVPGYYFNNEKQNEYVDGVGEININDNPVIILMKLKKELR